MAPERGPSFCAPGAKHSSLLDVTVLTDRGGFSPMSKPLPEVTMRRHKMSNRSSRKLFTRTADRVQSKNLRGTPMRGGIRL